MKIAREFSASYPQLRLVQIFKAIYVLQLYPWFEEDGLELILPEYRESFRNISPYGKVFLCVEEGTDCIKLQYRNELFKVKPKLFSKVTAPQFNFGDKVRLVKHPEQIGVICDINWHYKNNEEMYYMSLEGKKKLSRYLREDLIKM